MEQEQQQTASVQIASVGPEGAHVSVIGTTGNAAAAYLEAVAALKEKGIIVTSPPMPKA